MSASLPLIVRSTAIRLGGLELGLHTFAARQPLAGPSAWFDAYREVAGVLQAAGHVPLHEKTFGSLAAADDAADARARAFGGPATTGTWIEGRPCIGGELAGFQVWSASLAHGRLQPITGPGGTTGTLIESGPVRLLFLSAVTGADDSGRLPDGVAAQGRAMFDRADAMVREQGFTFRNVARTWLFLPRLLDWYGELNRVRNRFFDEAGLRGAGALYLPASTGIQGRHPSGAECFLDLVAVAGLPGGLSPMGTRRQNEAPRYGSSFSRGMHLGSAGSELMLVSGTASINMEGRTVYHGDAQCQIVETYADVAAVLDTRSARFPDVAAAIRYFKDQRTWETHCELQNAGLLPSLPSIDVLADVCRDELLFEMEVTAVRGSECPAWG